MKTIVGIMSVLIMATVMQVQAKPVAAVVGAHQDTALQQISTPEKGAPNCWQGREMPPYAKENFMLHGNSGPCANYGNHMPAACGFCPQPGMRMHGFAGHHFFHLLFLGLLVMGTVNILLTIIVSMDMVRTARFNGIWVPVILLAGIPGSVIYALFRIGDAIRQNKA